MATIRLIPSTYAVSNTTYVSVTDPMNMYTNVDSTTYATLTSSRAATTTYYVYIRGFNFSSIPADATINSFTIHIKGYESRMNTGATYAPALVNGTSLIANTTASTAFNTSTRTITVPTGALTWTNIVNYGNNFGVRVIVKRSNANNQGYLYIYGVEIEVDYTEPVASLPVRIKQNGTWLTPSKLLVKDGGSWKEARGIKAKSGGSWN